MTDVDRHLDRLQRLLAEAVAGLSTEELSWHPPGKWCVAEVLEHLYLTYTGTIKGFQRVIAADKPLASECKLKHRAGIFLVIGLGYMPSGREAPGPARPKGVEPEKVRAEIGTKIAELDEIIQRCEQRWGSNTKMLDHPILGPLTTNEWKKFHLVHGIHHLKQIRTLRQQATMA